MIRRPPRSTLFPTRRSSDLLDQRTGTGRIPERAGDSSGTICAGQDRKSTRLNSSHANISYAVFCLKKKRAIRVMSVHVGYTPPLTDFREHAGVRVASNHGGI